jgi:hypothetical protein
VERPAWALVLLVELLFSFLAFLLLERVPALVLEQVLLLFS